VNCIVSSPMDDGRGRDSFLFRQRYSKFRKPKGPWKVTQPPNCSLHRRWLILFNSVPFQMASATMSAPRFIKSTRPESALWANEHSPFTYTLVRTASALHPLSSRTDGGGVNVIHRSDIMQKMGNTPSQRICQQLLRLPGHAQSHPGPRVYWDGH